MAGRIDAPAAVSRTETAIIGVKKQRFAIPFDPSEPQISGQPSTYAVRCRDHASACPARCPATKTHEIAPSHRNGFEPLTTVDNGHADGELKRLGHSKHLN